MSTFVPWAMKDQAGNLVGFEIDVASRLAKDLGLKAEFVPTQWAGIFHDRSVRASFDSHHRRHELHRRTQLKGEFHHSVRHDRYVDLRPTKLAAGFKSVEDFDRPDVTVAVRMGATPVAAVKVHAQAKMRQFDDEAQAYQELLNGNVHAVVGSAPDARVSGPEIPGHLFVPIRGTFTREPIGMAVRKGYRIP